MDLEVGVKADDRSYSLTQLKSLPLSLLSKIIYPDLYRVDNLGDVDMMEDEEGILIPSPSLLQLSYERITATGMYLMDCGDIYYLYLCRGLHQMILEKTLGISRYI